MFSLPASINLICYYKMYNILYYIRIISSYKEQLHVSNVSYFIIGNHLRLKYKGSLTYTNIQTESQ